MVVLLVVACLLLFMIMMMVAIDLAGGVHVLAVFLKVS